MSSEQNTERIIDLLYDELTAEDATSVRQDLVDSVELRAEFDANDDFLRKFRESVPQVEVSSSVHESIMEAAASAAAERQVRANPIVRQPRQSFWKRVTQTQGAQIGLVATVLLAGAFVFRFINLDSSPQNMEAANEVAASRTFEPEPQADGVALKMDDFAPPVKAERKREAPADLERQKEIGAKRRDSSVADLSSKSKPKSSQRKGKVSRAKKKAPAPAKPTSTFESSAGVNSKADAKNVGLDYGSQPEEESDVYVGDAGSLDDVETKFGARDYRGTIAAADDYLNSSSGSKTDKARALELKAQSLSNSGRTTEAIRIYDSIMKNYPGYKTKAISSARADLDRRQEERASEKKTLKKRKAKKQYMFDEAEKSAPTSVDR